MNKFNLALSYALAVALVSNEAEAMTLRPTMESPAIALPEEFAQQFVADGNHTCDFAHRRTNDQQQVAVASILGSGQTFTDSTFPIEDAIDWDDHPTTFRSLDWLADSTYLQWSRLSETYPVSSGYSLFGTGVKPDDVEQGSIGNCWFLAAAASVAEVPGRLESHWITQEMNSEGIYALNMYVLGVPVSVVVDDRVPHYGSTYNTIFAKVQRTGEKTTWMTILEKAYAKIEGNYAQLVGGWAKVGVQTLTGFPSESITNADLTQAALWSFLDSGDDNNDIITAGTHYNPAGDTSTNDDGIAYSHAYSVIGTETITDLSGASHQLVRIRNPWKSEGYIGDWSDADTRWNNVSSATKTAIGHTNSAYDGYFFMSLESFQRNFEDTSINRDLTGWKHSHFLMTDDQTTAATSPGNLYYCGASCARHTFTLNSPVSQRVHVTAYLHDERSYPTDCSFRTNWSAVSTNFAGYTSQTAFVDGSKYLGEHTLNGDYTVQLEFPWEAVPDMTRDFSLVVWAEQEDVTITHERGLTSAEWPLQGGEGETPAPGPVTFPDHQLAFDSIVRSQQITATFDSTTHECVTQVKTMEPFADGKDSLWASTTCEDSVSLSFIVMGSPAEFLTNTGGSACTQQAGYLQCNVELSQGVKWGALFSDDFDLSSAVFAYTYTLTDASGATLQSLERTSTDLVTLGPEVAYVPPFSDFQAGFDAFVAADTLDTTYDTNAYECISAFQYRTYEGNSAITLQSDCPGYVSVAMIFPGDFSNTEYLNNSSVTLCQNQTTYLYCSVGIQNGGKWGLLVNQPFSIENDSAWYYAAQLYSATYDPIGETINAMGTESIIYGPEVVVEPTGPTEIELRGQLDAWLATLTVGSFDTAAHMCAGQFFSSTIDGRPVVAFSHQCPSHNVDLSLNFDASVFGALDTDIVVGSQHMETSCDPDLGCSVTVQRNVPFGIMLNDNYVEGDYLYNVDWIRV